MKQVFLSKKGISIENVPEPVIANKMIVVKNLFSCISPGTEMAGLKSIKSNILKKIYQNPSIVRNVLNVFKSQGVSKTHNVIKNKLGQFYEIGYSSSGIIEKVGKDIKSLSVGDFVACAGGGIASHAEKILVPENLAVKVNNPKNMDSYSTVALGAISLHSIRRLKPSLGDSCLVVGLGFIGQITIQLLRTNGVSVYGIDPNPDFLKKATNEGFENVYSSFEKLKTKIPSSLTDQGFDGIIINASNTTEKILDNCIGKCRRKAKIVIVGDINLKFDRELAYKKEIDILMSTSYGPGRYDNNYEILGHDYPIEYVRWTLKRNMQAYIGFLDSKKVIVKNLLGGQTKIEDVCSLYDSFEKNKRPISAVIKYDHKNTFIEEQNKYISSKQIKIKPHCAIIGAGGFSKEILIPNLLKMKDKCQLSYLCVKRPVSALNLSTKYKGIKVLTNYKEILDNKEIDTVFVSTRHNLHYQIAKECLIRKKNVFVEKPTCTTSKELKSLKNLFHKKNQPILVTGFNRRFSKCAEIMSNFIKNSNSEVILDYQVNADQISQSSWVYSEEGGGRNIGEACHFYDLILFLISSNIQNVYASSISNRNNKNIYKTDNFVVIIKFSDGSLARLNYLTKGNNNDFKEIIEIRSDESTLIMKDFKIVEHFQSNQKTVLYSESISSKGHTEQLEEFFKNLKNSNVSIPLESQFKVMELCFKIEDLL